MSETKETKTARKGIIIALGIVCIVLVASLFGAIAYYTMTTQNKENELSSANIAINQLNVTIAKQNNTISQLNNTITNLQNQVALDNSTLTKLQNQIASDNTTITSLEAHIIVIDGITYSTNPTPYGHVLIAYFTLGINLQWVNAFFWLLTPSEPLPPDSLVEVVNGSTPFIPIDPYLYGQVMINNWLYDQTPTNFTKFTLSQPMTITLWTCTASEPIPTNAQVLG